MELLGRNYFRGFGVTHGHIRISYVYLNAVKSIFDQTNDKRQRFASELANLFESSDIIAGDLNSTPGVLRRFLAEQSDEWVMESFPTYLFPGGRLDGAANIPCFDNVIRRMGLIVYAKALYVLPDTLSTDPREYMRQHNLPSDHVPVSFTLHTDENKLSSVVYNVADPLCWAPFYPNAGHGFSLDEESEAQRQQTLLDQIQGYTQTHDIVFLQEVPARLAKAIRAQYPHAQSLDLQSEHEVSDISQVMLVQKQT